MSEAPYITVYKDKWNAIRSIKAITKSERQKLAAAMLDYACSGIEPEGLSNLAQGMFEAIKSSLLTRSKGGQPGNQNATKDKTKDKTNNKTNTENEQVKRIEKTIEQTNCTETDTDTEANTDKPPLPPKGIDSAFEKFWEAYPKKVGKQDARRSYERATKNKGPLFKNNILKALEDQKQSDQWTRENGRFIPNPATWLNQGRWDDELEKPEPETPPEPEYHPIQPMETCKCCGSDDVEGKGLYYICRSCGASYTWNSRQGEWIQTE